MERVLSGAVQSDVDVQLLELEGWAAWLEAGVAGPQAPVNFRLAPPCISCVETRTKPTTGHDTTLRLVRGEGPCVVFRINLPLA